MTLHRNRQGIVYLRVKQRGRWRDWLLHRRVMAEAIEEFGLIGGQVIPEGVIPAGCTVHHIDHNPLHNCRANLMLLDIQIHGYLAAQDRYRKQRTAQEAEDLEVSEYLRQEHGIIW